MKVFLALTGYVSLGKFLELCDPQFSSLQTWKVSPSSQENTCKELSSVHGMVFALLMLIICRQQVKSPGCSTTKEVIS